LQNYGQQSGIILVLKKTRVVYPLETFLGA